MKTQRPGLTRRYMLLCGAALASLGLLPVTACNSNGPTLKAYVAVAPPTSPMVEAGSTTFLMASAVPTGVTWNLSGNGCSGAACGSLANATDTSVNYVAPQTISGSSLVVTISAASSTSSSVASSITLTVLPVSVTIAPPTSDVVAPGAGVQLTASVANDLSGEGVSWSLVGVSGCSGASCGTLNNATATSVVYTAPQGASGLGVQVVATSVADPAISASQDLTVPALSNAIKFTPANLPEAIAGQPYSATVTVTGGTAPYTFTVTGQPSWITVTNSGDTVTFAGTPPAGTTGGSALQIIAIDSSLPVALTNIAQMTLTTYPTAGVNNGLLTGTYAFYGTGWMDGSTTPNTQPVSYIGSFTADGNGNITGGEMDTNGAGGYVSYPSLAGTYNLDANQEGLISIMPQGAAAPITLAVGLAGVQNNVASTGFFTEYDDTTGVGVAIAGGSSGIRISGPIALEDPSVQNTASSPLTGSYAFGMEGRNPVSEITSACNSGHTPSCGPVSLAGAMTMASSGAIASGMEDITEAETTASQVPFSGALNNTGNADAFGRITGAINVSSSSLIAWPTNFIVYMVNPQTFYIMSADTYATSTLVTGQAMQQNLADIAATPFSSTQQLILYGNVASTQNYPNPNGNTRVELMNLTVAPTSAATGSVTGNQFVNASGTFSNNSKISQFTYTVASDTGRVATSNSSWPDMYLADTDTGFATNYSSSAGLFMLQPQTATTLNAGTFAWSNPIPNSQLTVAEAGTMTVPTGGVAATASNIAVTGEAYASYANTSTQKAELPAGGANGLLFNGSLTGTISNTNGMIPAAGFTLNGGAMACNGGGGYIISPTEFACISTTKGYDTIVLFQQ